jgi:uncharacterized protein with von Willebrand factor type A (vWA) domain
MQPYTAGHANHVYLTSRWQNLLWNTRLDASVSLKAATASVAVVVDAADEANDFGGELFARLYNDPEKLANPPGAAWMQRAHEVAAEGQEWDALHAATEGDADFSAIATRGLLKAVAEKLPGLLEQLENEAESDGPPEEGETPTAGDMLAAALRTAARGLAAELNDVRTALEGLAPGLGSAPDAGHENDPRRMQLADTLRRDDRLRDILRRAGRIERISRKRQQVRSTHAREEVVDIERGADIARILPAGLARLHHPLLRKLALREIVEGTAIQYRLEGKEPQGRGPIIVLLDESGSMRGEPHTWARAIGVAAISQGAKEKRPVTVIGFDTEVTSCHRLTAGGEARELKDKGREEREGRLMPGGVAELILAVCTLGTHGGTNFTQPIQFAMSCGLREDKADLVFVTDGLADIAPAMLGQLTEQKKTKGMRVFGVVLNGGSTSPAVRAICDHVVELDRASDPGAALGAGIM